MKRLVVGVFVSGLTIFGVAPAASAGTFGSASVVKVAKVKKATPPKVIDWDAPTRSSGGSYSAQRIDWD